MGIAISSPAHLELERAPAKGLKYDMLKRHLGGSALCRAEEPCTVALDPARS